MTQSASTSVTIRIAILEEDTDEAKRLGIVLTPLGVCDKFTDLSGLLHAISDQAYDVALINWVIPEILVSQLIENLRSTTVSPRIVIVLSNTQHCDEAIVAGLSAGADDFIAKPVRDDVLLARVERLVRRNATREYRVIEDYGAYKFDKSRYIVTLNGVDRALTRREFYLALFLFRNMQTPLAREHINLEVWGPQVRVSSRTLDTHICRIKAKLQLVLGNGFRCSTVYGFGYRLDKIVDDKQVDAVVGGRGVDAWLPAPPAHPIG